MVEPRVGMNIFCFTSALVVVYFFFPLIIVGTPYSLPLYLKRVIINQKFVVGIPSVYDKGICTKYSL